jgi:hypothetical protein
MNRRHDGRFRVHWTFAVTGPWPGDREQMASVPEVTSSSASWLALLASPRVMIPNERALPAPVGHRSASSGSLAQQDRLTPALVAHTGYR